MMSLIRVVVIISVMLPALVEAFSVGGRPVRRADWGDCACLGSTGHLVPIPIPRRCVCSQDECAAYCAKFDVEHHGLLAGAPQCSWVVRKCHDVPLPPASPPPPREVREITFHIAGGRREDILIWALEPKSIRINNLSEVPKHVNQKLGPNPNVTLRKLRIISHGGSMFKGPKDDPRGGYLALNPFAAKKNIARVVRSPLQPILHRLSKTAEIEFAGCNAGRDESFILSLAQALSDPRHTVVATGFRDPRTASSLSQGARTVCDPRGCSRRRPENRESNSPPSPNEYSFFCNDRGSCYEMGPKKVTWQEAWESLLSSNRYKDEYATLLNIGDEDEREWLRARFGGVHDFWVAGKRPRFTRLADNTLLPEVRLEERHYVIVEVEP